ncbi:Por secretion system C-terminal sorting domain-containing protein [Arachidicoccus rhizosphaerae]|uniref:Por secretion system C-terminal sorting domain-containing protein n=1 Tax=Arachidicoccus rhizosphaerae TaxID=551991 RepID=A0A1H3W056_9BACT|nr:C25 family cysteine peptidase [Arachidicoccus rhizosphaerae]SDZ80439.1 Por secretion system C-terminal sorting domain-containing protein [Arachidicoccus rhizosphaerae]
MCKNWRRGGIAFLLFVILLGLQNITQAQTYNNEWIVNGNTYYKFKIATDGLYRITGSNLSAAGLSNPIGANLQLWRNGVQIPISVSTTGALGSTDYIEFWGQHNDGSVDTALFKNTADQLNKAKSFEGDSATYFLTINATSQNLRYTNEANIAATEAAGMTAEPYFYNTVQKELGSTFNAGAATSYNGEYVYMSDYKGKCFGVVVQGTKNTSITFNNLNAYTSDATVTGIISAGIAGASTDGNNRSITVKGTDGANTVTALGNFEAKVINVSGAKITSSYTVTVTNGSSNTTDKINASFVSLHYPHTFEFGDTTCFGFDLGASSTARLLNISHFNANGSIPVLLDLTSHKRYTAVTSGSNYLFVLPPVVDSSSFALVGQSASSYASITGTAITKRVFPDYSSTDQQGDYLIISNTTLYGSGDYVAQYATYRKSAAGGGYNPHIYNIDDLEDMFAFGVHSSPLSIINFLKYARNNFSTTPKFVFLIGRGLSFNNLQGANAANAEYQAQALIPTFGWPASDIMLASDNKEPIAATAIGRLSAVKPDEVANYLEKVKVYELAQKTDDNTVENNAWKKKVVYISGGSSTTEDNLFNSYLDGYRSILSGDLYGAFSLNLSKVNNDIGESADAAAFGRYIENGVGLISYYGHGSSTTIGYNQLIDPSAFNYNNRYPILVTSGCDVGDCYSFMSGRASTINNITERYLLSKEKGSVGFVAETYLGVTSYLNIYNTSFYNSLASSNYGKPITTSMALSQADIVDKAGKNSRDSITCYAHAEQTNFFGDPAISLYYFNKPDFAVGLSDLEMPNAASITEGTFHLKAYLHNIGQSTGSTVHVIIQQKRTNGEEVTLYNNNISSIKNIDSLELDVPIDPNKDGGMNQITLSIDDDNKYDEISETNNVVSKNIHMYTNGITPVFPYQYSIIRKSSGSVFASTSNALAPEDNYIMEMDTTKNFNSTNLISQTIKSVGGVISFDPGIIYQDSVVYYWRVSPVPAIGEDYRWANSSFQYIAPNGGEGSEGIGQSHFMQHLKSTFDGINIDTTDRDWSFKDRDVSMIIGQAVVGSGISTGYSNFKIIIGTDPISSYYCTKLNSSLLFNIFDPNSFKPYINQSVPSTVETGSIGGFMGATSACLTGSYSYDTDPTGHPNTNKGNFQFSYQTEEDRNKIVDFIDWIPNGTYVVMRLFVKEPFNNVSLIDTWKNDASGDANLYSKLMAQGLTLLDDFTQPQAGIFIFRKNNNSLTPIQKLTGDVNGQLLLTETFQGKDSIGYVTSPKFGPAKQWASIQWNGKSNEEISTDHASVDVIGVTSNGATSVLRTLNSNEQDVDISSIDATNYPYLQLRLRNADSINYTPYELRYWHVMYTPVPEGALAGNLGLELKDTLDLGDDYNFAIAFQNVSNQTYSDSIKASITIKDSNNRVYTIPVSRLKPLEPGDTAMLRFVIPGYYSKYNAANPTLSPLDVQTSALAGNNTLSISLNPDNTPIEQTLENNSLVQSFYVKSASLPIDFGKVTATLVSDYSVSLSWHILTSINSDYYIVQRSSDGKTYQEVSRINSLGDGTNDISYSALDNIQSLSGQPATVYYRIVAVDKEGYNYYSQIVNVHPTWPTWTVTVAPNPITQDQLQLILSSKESTSVIIKLTDMSGRVLLNRSVTASGNGRISINTPHLTTGVYIVQVIQGTHTVSTKVIRK